MSEPDVWGPPVHAEPSGKEEWGAPVHAAGSSSDNPLDDTAHAAGPATIARASLAPDPEVQKQRYAEAFKQPISDFGIVGDHIIRRVPETGEYARVEPSVRGATGPIDAAQRAFDWVAGGVGPAIPAVASGAAATAAAILATPETLGAGTLPAGMAAGAGGASAGEVARQKLDAALAPKGDEAPMDWKNVAWQGAAGAAGPLAGKALDAIGGRIAPVLAQAAADELPAGATAAREGVAGGATPVVGGATSFGLNPRVVDALKEHIANKQAEIDQLQRDVDSFTTPVQLSLGQKTGSEAVRQSERQLIRQPETVQAIADLRADQNLKQIPGITKEVMEEIAPGSTQQAPAQAVSAFRDSAQGVIDKEVGERSDMADYMYGPLAEGKSTAPLEDQFRQATIQATAQKGQIAKQISDIEKNQSGALAARGAAGADTRAQYMDLRDQLQQAETNRVAVLDRFKQAQADGTANKQGAVWSPRLQEFFDDPKFKPALANGLELQRIESTGKGIPFKPTDYAIVGKNADGSPIVGAVPNFRTVQAFKKGIDAVIESNTDPATGLVNPLGRAASIFKDGFLKEADNLLPGYAQARAAYGTDSEAIDAIRNGGVGLLNKMSGTDRMNMINRVFSGDNVMAPDIADMRRQFIYAGKGAEWKNATAAYIGDALADAVKPLQTGGMPNNVGGKLYTNLFEQRQSDIIKAALGGDANDALVGRWNALGRILQAASRQLPEGSATATDTGAPGIARRGVQALSYVLKPQGAAADMLDGLAKMQDPAMAKKLGETLLTPEGDKLLKTLQTTTPGSPKANSILQNLLTQAGLVTAEGGAARAEAGQQP